MSWVIKASPRLAIFEPLREMGVGATVKLSAEGQRAFGHAWGDATGTVVAMPGQGEFKELVYVKWNHPRQPSDDLAHGYYPDSLELV